MGLWAVGGLSGYGVRVRGEGCWVLGVLVLGAGVVSRGAYVRGTSDFGLKT
jgi:hypothetical protein